jgi:restriction system protein
MAKRQSLFEDLIEIAAKLPWWIGILLALVSYAILHSVAGMENVAPKDLNAFGGFASKQLIKTAAMVGQYLLPAAFLIGTAMSAYGRRKRGDLHCRVANASDAGVLHDMSWQEFEMLVGEAFRLKGFTVRETGSAGPDGGVDLELTSGSEKYLVQCKQWRALKVNVNTVRELYGVMTATGASGGFVVTSGEFTKDAADFVRGLNIELIDKKQLMALIKDARQSLDASRQSGSQSNTSNDLVAKSESMTNAAAPSCPRCGSAMTKRVAKKGPSAGRSFWGCTTYPRCQGTLPSD